MTHESIPKVAEKYAIFADGGKQYQAVPGRTVELEKKKDEVGSTIELSSVLLRKDGQKIDIGAPYLPGASIKATILQHTAGPKLTVYKFKRRKKYRVKKGHRQDLTIVRIVSI